MRGRKLYLELGNRVVGRGKERVEILGEINFGEVRVLVEVSVVVIVCFYGFFFCLGFSGFLFESLF